MRLSLPLVIDQAKFNMRRHRDKLCICESDTESRYSRIGEDRVGRLGRAETGACALVLSRSTGAFAAAVLRQRWTNVRWQGPAAVLEWQR